MKSRSKELLDRSIAAMIAAVDIYNKPNFPYRADTFAILAFNAWELLIKAKWLSENKNALRSLYVYKTIGKTKKTRILRNRTGNPLTESADSLAKKLICSNKLDCTAWNNIMILIELRDNSIHFYNKSPALLLTLQGIGAACLKNFATASLEWFNRPLSEFELHLMPLALVHLPSYLDGIVIHPEEKKFMEFVKKMDSESSSSSPYFVTVNVEVTFTKSTDPTALLVRSTNDPTALAIQLTEEDIRTRYPWDYKEITDRCKKRYDNFKIDSEYHSLRKKLESNPKYAMTRHLDPYNQKGQKKTFFSSNILQELDKHYTSKKF